MRIGEFDYGLPAELIAQEPAERRDASRMLIVDRVSSAVSEVPFDRLDRILHPNDLLVVNETRVRPARLLARKMSGGSVEVLQIERVGGEPGCPVWACLVSSSGGFAVGDRLFIGADLEAEVVDRIAAGRFHLRFRSEYERVDAALRRYGRMPLPHYIRRSTDDPRADMDRERYQTVYARNEGAIAAPTAGLHFTEALIHRLEAKGVGIARLTLHVGPGTFAPVRVDEIEAHQIEPEGYVLPAETSHAVACQRSQGGRVVAVGTTVTRVLEGCARDDGSLRPGSGVCGLYIKPGHRFRIVDALITNLHLPRSSLLILVSAFAGRERILSAYGEAVRRRFRFHSYGDAMLIQ